VRVRVYLCEDAVDLVAPQLQKNERGHQRSSSRAPATHPRCTHAHTLRVAEARWYCSYMSRANALRSPLLKQWERPRRGAKAVNTTNNKETGNENE